MRIAAMSLSLFAQGMWTVVMALQVIAVADDPAALSVVSACLALGMLAFILVGGIVADRVNQRAVIIAVEAANVAATGVSRPEARPRPAATSLVAASRA